jgi:hypothetical protein
MSRAELTNTPPELFSKSLTEDSWDDAGLNDVVDYLKRSKFLGCRM